MRCAVFGCNVDNKSKSFRPGIIKFHTFPKDKEMQAVWKRVCERKDNFNINNARVCSKHFSNDEYERNLKHELLGYTPLSYRSLKKTAVPSKHLNMSRQKGTSGTTISSRVQRLEKRQKKVMVKNIVKGKYSDSESLQPQIMSNLEEAKKIAAYQSVDNHVKSGYTVGIGSGSTVIYAVERLAQRVQKEELVVKCVPTSFQARQLVVKHRLTLTDLDISPKLDVCIDGADEVDSNLNLIKGGGGCLLQEKIVASCAKQLIIIADYTKNSRTLGQQYKKGIPIEVSPMAYIPITNRLQGKYKGQFTLRMAINKAGPVVTDNGNFILDWKEFDQTLPWEKLNEELIMIPGVIETGLFIKMASKAYFGMPDGSVKIQQ